jgi:imidazolonepropionase-like amidohydrolase
VATTIVNAGVFDGENMRPWTSVRFEGGVITHCTERPAVMLGDEVVDADGGTLLPGLIDAHIHRSVIAPAYGHTRPRTRVSIPPRRG